MKNYAFRISLLLSGIAACFCTAGCEGNLTTGSAPGLDASDSAAGDSAATEYTILLTQFSGSNARTLAALQKKQASKHPDFDDINIIRNSDGYQLLQGKYLKASTAREKLNRVKSWKDTTGRNPFKNAKIIEIPGSEFGPGDWNLAKVRHGYYSYQVAVFYDMYKKDTPGLDADYVGRKKFAVDYCRRLREKGYESFFFHGPSNSVVTIGIFDKKAIKNIKKKTIDPKTGEINEGSFVESHVILSKKMLKLQKKFPYMQINGGGQQDVLINPKTRRLEKRLLKTYAVSLPYIKNPT